MDRRRFLQTTAASAAAAAGTIALEQVAKASAGERVRVGMIGAAGRAGALNQYFAANKYAEIVVIADVDTSRIPNTLEAVTTIQGQAALRPRNRRPPGVAVVPRGQCLRPADSVRSRNGGVR